MTTSTASRHDHALGGLGPRTTSGLVLAALVFGSVATVPTFTIVVLLITLGSLYELAGLAERKGQPLIFPVAAVAVFTYIVLAALNLQHTYEKAVLAGTVIASLGFSLAGSLQGYFERAASTVMSALYIGWLGSYFLALRNLPHDGIGFAVASIVAIAFTDIFAMLVGRSIGRTPLTVISPNKTWEGALGGFAATVGVCVFAVAPVLGLPWWHAAVIGAVTSVAAQVGDIVESALKRDARVKDAGSVMPGHGGILDRFDSYLFGGIAFYAALYCTGHVTHP